MADKEATVYIIDLGASMGRRHSGREQTDLEWAMQWVWDKITYTVSTGRKQFNVGVVGLRTDRTRNEFSGDDGYKNVSVIKDLGPVLMPDLRKLGADIKSSSTQNGDAVSAVIIAIEMIRKLTKELKYIRKIYLVTNGDGLIDSDDVEDIANQLVDRSISLTVLGIDFDDVEFGYKEDSKSGQKKKNERVLAHLVELCPGDSAFGTMKQAISELGAPRVKSVRPTPSYKGLLTLGDPESDHSDSVLRIYVERYPRVALARPPTASAFVTRSDLASNMESTASSGTIEAGHDTQPHDENNLTAVRSTHTYQVTDESIPGGKRDIVRDELEKGYEYGREAVHISASDETITKLDTEAGLEIMGFIPQHKFDRYLAISNSCMIVGSRTDPKAILALSSFIHALFEMETYAVARLVVKSGKEPLVVILAPSIETDYECLIEVQMPFAEDVRSYRFPPLDQVITVSGKVVTEHRNLPKDDLMKAMSNYVDQLDLSGFDQTDEGEPTEYMPMDDTFSPIIHRIDQAIRFRAVHPTDELPSAPGFLTKYTQIPESLQEDTAPYLKRLIDASDVKKVPPKAKGRKRNRDAEKPLSGLNIDELLTREKRVRICVDNAIPEFKQMLSNTGDLSIIRDAVRQLTSIIESHIKNSLGDSGYDRAAEEIGTMRSEMIEYEEPGLYNSFIQALKKDLLEENLGGDRREMWWRVRSLRLGLIDSHLSPQSRVSEEEAKEFLRAT